MFSASLRTVDAVRDPVSYLLHSSQFMVISANHSLDLTDLAINFQDLTRVKVLNSTFFGTVIQCLNNQNESP